LSLARRTPQLTGPLYLAKKSWNVAAIALFHAALRNSPANSTSRPPVEGIDIKKQSHERLTMWKTSHLGQY
jgi:hypothetical protein